MSVLKFTECNEALDEDSEILGRVYALSRLLRTDFFGCADNCF